MRAQQDYRATSSLFLHNQTNLLTTKPALPPSKLARSRKFPTRRMKTAPIRNLPPANKTQQPRFTGSVTAYQQKLNPNRKLDINAIEGRAPPEAIDQAVNFD